MKVFVGLSGGVDSAVSAALLKEKGNDVVGAFIKIWQPEFIECTWKRDRLDAMRVCVSLDIPFREIDLSDEYKKNVIDTMLAEYTRGITPNPDILCNRHIKFGPFAAWARAQGADMVATGHYARIRHTGDTYELLRGIDAGKDQSYFLSRLTEDDLAHSLFPLGEYEKSYVRALAGKYELPVAKKPDSQGLCFVGEVGMPEFLSRFITLESGPVVDTDGTTIGTHKGAALYTVGQRHGFDIKGGDAASAYYVTGINAATNTLHVSRQRTDAERKDARLRDVHWIGHEPALPARVMAQARYHERSFAAELKMEGGRYTATFDSPHIATPGQTLVMYDGDVLQGCGVIE